jgi:hypothetical protein
MFGHQLELMLPTLTGPATAALVHVFELAKFEFFYLGLFLLPISIVVVASIVSALPRNVARLLLISVVVTTAALALWSGQTMPIWFDTLRFNGIGPYSGGIMPPLNFWLIVTVLAQLGGILLLTGIFYAAYNLLVSYDNTNIKSGLAFAFLGAGSLSVPISLIDTFMRFDRYLLPIIPWLSLALASSTKRAGLARAPNVLGAIFICLMAGYSVLNVHNLLAEKRVIVKALDDLGKEGVPRDSIDASWIFNGETLYGLYGSKNSEKGWYKSRDYVIGPWQEPDYKLVRSYPVARWSIRGLKGTDVFVWRRSSID